ncbi:CatA-like O-acetyltransferase [Bradyrhizobium nitroreducens]|uniref:CatA-like O-acetyltransferase n=1 Tax=Bradyrhizobium nitroreducens TaxID=709803 RepID=UPI000C1F4B0D|nr:CatA-like O-acetyltransferase [Bradyrhizobium nitroreducens]
MFNRQDHLDFFAAYDLPVVNITTECRCRDFAATAKAKKVPPFAVMLHAIARTSLALGPFRRRILDGRLRQVERLRVSYPVDGMNGNLNYSTFLFDDDFSAFLKRYLADGAEARQAQHLRLSPMEDRDHLFVTCLPWLHFTSIQHPIARLADCSIPNIAVGRFQKTGDSLVFPLAVQAHHGLVDGLHIQQFASKLEEMLNEAAEINRNE